MPFVKGQKQGRQLRLYVVHYVVHYWDWQMRECQDSDVVRSEFNFSTLGIELGTWEKKKIQGRVMKLLQKVQVGGM